MHQAQLTQQSADLLVAVLAASPDIVIVIDGDGVISFANEAARRVLGHAPEEWLGRSAFELIHPDDRQRVSVELVTRISDPVADFAPVELRIAHLTGEWVAVEAQAIRPVRDAAWSGMAVVLRDITARIDSEERLASTCRGFGGERSSDRVKALPNRERIGRHIDRLARSRPDSVVGMDVLADLIMVKIADVGSMRRRWGDADTDATIAGLAERVCCVVGPDHVVGTARDGEFVVVVEWMPRGLDQLADRLLRIAEPEAGGRAGVDLAVSVVPLCAGMSGAEALERLSRAADWCARRSPPSGGLAPPRPEDAGESGSNVIPLLRRPRQAAVPPVASDADPSSMGLGDLLRNRRALLG